MSDASPLPASRLRRALGLYIDYLLFSSVLTLLALAASAWWPALGVPGLPVQVALFLALEAALLYGLRWTPAFALLGIHYRAAGPRLPQVEPGLAAAETRWTLLLGVLLLMDGSKTLVRWGLWQPPQPVFGWVPDATVDAVLAVASGAVMVVIGIGVLRARSALAWAGCAFYLLLLLSELLSMELRAAWAEAELVARHAWLDRPLADDRIAFARQWVPPLAVGMAALMAAWLAAAARHFRRRT